MKTFDRKDIFSWINADEAKKYVGKYGYFADGCFHNLKEWAYGELTNVCSNGTIVETFSFNNEDTYGLFLPAEKVREEKTYRPFRNQGEIEDYFNRLTMVECPLDIQHKRTSERFTLAVTGIFENGLVLPLYGALTWEQLFNGFDLYINGTKQPFGVLEE